MIVPEGYHSVASGNLASVQTYLQMLSKAPLQAARENPEWKLDRVRDIELARYRTLFRRVGEDYLWASRLVMPDNELASVLQDPLYELYVLAVGSRDEGVVELDFRIADECELKFFGVTPELVRSGVGRWLMNRAIDIAWSHTIERFWVHTCNLDHPNALEFYVHSGFTPYKRDVEVYGDPRALGVIRRDAAPQVPLL